jgi:hypothetical protein
MYTLFPLLFVHFPINASQIFSEYLAKCPTPMTISSDPSFALDLDFLCFVCSFFIITHPLLFLPRSSFRLLSAEAQEVSLEH